MSFFYENIINWLRKELESIGTDDTLNKLTWLFLLREAVGELIAEMESHDS